MQAALAAHVELASGVTGLLDAEVDFACLLAKRAGRAAAMREEVSSAAGADPILPPELVTKAHRVEAGAANAENHRGGDIN